MRSAVSPSSSPLPLSSSLSLVPPRACACLPRVSLVRPLLDSIRPEASGGYPPNLSISLSGGKEINRDLLSSGERTGVSPALNRGPPRTRHVG